jgi:CelD/BcsL family acetyltransferase involved in cellulose biosynthesis
MYTWNFLPLSDFSQIAPQWDQLNQETFKSPILQSNFVQPALKNFSTGNEIIATCIQNNRVIAMGIFYKYKFGCWSTFQPSQAPIGLWLCFPDMDLETALKSLAKTLPGPCFIISLLQQDCNLLSPPAHSKTMSTMDYIETAKISLNSDFDTYWQERSKNTKKSVRKQHKKLEERELAVSLETLSNPEDINEAIAQYGQLETAGWKAQNNTAIHPDNPQGAFYSQILNAFCSEKNGLIFKYWIGDQVAAVDLCVADEESIVILKTTYNENLGEFSPALLMHAEIFEYLFKQQTYKTIEFYGRVMDWHKKWTNEIRKLYHINFYSNSLVKYCIDLKSK